MLVAGAGRHPPQAAIPEGGIDPPPLPRVRPSLPQRRTQWATTQGQTAGPGLASFYSPPPGKDWARPGYVQKPPRTWCSPPASSSRFSIRS